MCRSNPPGHFYIYADCSKFTDDSQKFAQQLLETEGLAVTPGKRFLVIMKAKSTCVFALYRHAGKYRRRHASP
jgi:Aspartate/tyrosine/aromatic aminotransferase